MECHLSLAYYAVMRCALDDSEAGEHHARDLLAAYHYGEYLHLLTILIYGLTCAHLTQLITALITFLHACSIDRPYKLIYYGTWSSRHCLLSSMSAMRTCL